MSGPHGLYRLDLWEDGAWAYLCPADKVCLQMVEGPSVPYAEWINTMEGGMAKGNSCIFNLETNCCERPTPTEDFSLTARQLIATCMPLFVEYFSWGKSERCVAQDPGMADSAMLISCSSTSTSNSSELATTTAWPLSTSSASEEWHAVNWGKDQACRGASHRDNSPSYYSVAQVDTLNDCKAHCEAMQGFCKGVEYSTGRCELWTRAEGIGATEGKQGFSCFHYLPAPVFIPIEGGLDRVCRGATSSDNNPKDFTVIQVLTLQQCQQMCMKWQNCVGIEFSFERCEIWTRPEGIKATLYSPDHTCMRYERRLV